MQPFQRIKPPLTLIIIIIIIIILIIIKIIIIIIISIAQIQLKFSNALYKWYQLNNIYSIKRETIKQKLDHKYYAN